MMVRLLLGVAFVANVLVLVLCTETTKETATSASSASVTSPSSYASSTASSEAVATSKPKCHKDKKCPKNEEFSSCAQSIRRPQYCTEKDKPCSSYKSTSVKSQCKEACVCKKNFLRAENGTCIPAELCPLTCDVNELLDNCPSDCAYDYCPTKEDSGAASCLTPDVCPPPKCKCGFNYRRASNGTCIPTRECPPFPCKTNEEFNACPPLCPTDDCSQASPTGECPPLFGNIGIVLPCNPKCRCIKGYWRLDGVCVPYGQCPGVCPNNERYSECIQGECRALDCAQKDQSIPCVRIDPQYCKKGCVCEEGYLRNQEGVCVKEDKCEPLTCISPNEELVPCMQGVCRAKYCSEKGQDVPCPDIPPEQCDSGCICKENFLRAANGTCVPEKNCEPGVCPNNERYSECIQGECRALDCAQKDQSIPCVRIDPQYCKKGCVCEEGYLRNQEGVCVKEDKCDPLTCISPNEELVPCMQGVCRAKYCSEKGQDVPCPDIPPEQCDSGCICKENFLRAANGTCVPEENCEPNTCPVNEEFSNCTQALCRAKDCYERYLPIPCPNVSEESCEKGCVCKWGYLRDVNNVCIPNDQCPENPCPHNQRFTNCTQTKCVQKCFDEKLPEGCPVVAEGDCMEGCVCQEGYLQAEDGYCVPEDQCESTKCPPFEQWVFCSNANCGPEFCYQKGLSLPCPGVSQCIPGCLCQGGYLRNESGVCVPEAECKQPQPTCGENEILDECPQTCNTDYCPQSPDEEQKCTQSDPCVPTCKCRFNYKRAENGTCIPTTECPAFDCSAKENEVYVACPPYCPSDECSKPRLTGRCPFRIGIVLECKPKCQCKDGYGRVNGTCVPFAECPDLCPSKEVYSPCIQETCRPQNCSDRDVAMETCPASDPESCQRGCVCQENYYRNEKGICVSYEECGGPMCPNPHEVYTPNFLKCPPNICNSLVAKYKCDGNQIAEPACACESSYLRLNETSSCIPICECPEMASSPDCK